VHVGDANGRRTAQTRSAVHIDEALTRGGDCRLAFLPLRQPLLLPLGQPLLLLGGRQSEAHGGDGGGQRLSEAVWVEIPRLWGGSVSERAHRQMKRLRLPGLQN